MDDSDPPRHSFDYPRAALVTGAGRRLGKAIALRLARDGWSLAIHYGGSAAEAEAVAEEVRALGRQALTLQADLAEEVQVARLVPAAVEALGPLGCLVNSASRFELDSPETADRRSWDRHLEPNLRAPFVLSQAFAKALPAGRGGLIVNLLDQRVWNLTPYFTSYTLTKAALWDLTRTLALALAPRIRVVGIGPGPALPSPHQSPEQFARQCAIMPLGIGTTPQEVAQTVAFLLATPSITGQMIALDGGQHLGWAQPGQDVVEID